MSTGNTKPAGKPIKICNRELSMPILNNNDLIPAAQIVCITKTGIKYFEKLRQKLFTAVISVN